MNQDLFFLPYTRRHPLHLSGSDIVNLFSSPPIAIPAPGSGKYAQPWFASVRFVPGTCRYVNFNDVTISPFLNAVADQQLWFALQCKDQAFTEQLATSVAWMKPVGIEDEGLPSVESTALSDLEDMPYYLLCGEAITHLGLIVSSTLAAGGAGYAPGDTGTISGGGLPGVWSTPATYTVLTVSGGAVATYSITNHDPNYPVRSGFNGDTSVLTGGGNGAFSINITAITPADGDLYINTHYSLEDA